MEILLQLQFTPLFAGVPETDLRALVEGAHPATVAAGAELYREGEPVERFFVVLDGHVELSVADAGRRSVVEVVKRGAVLGDAAMFAGTGFLMTARAITDARVLAVPAAAFRQRLEGRVDTALHMLSTMSVRLRMLVRQISELKLKTTAQRLGGFLLSLAPEDAEGRVVLRFPYDKKLVAEQLGMKPESLSRALAKLAKLGVDSRPDNEVAIADVDRLREFCVEDDQG